MPEATPSAKAPESTVPDTKKDTAGKQPDAPAVAGRPAPADPLGDLAAARTNSGGNAGGTDPFFYFVQAGAFRTPEDAEAQRAKLSLMGIEAKVTEREQSGRQVYRVRVGPFNSKDDADRQKEKLDAGGFDTALVRVQR
jgi:cell division protein FtsN